MTSIVKGADRGEMTKIEARAIETSSLLQLYQAQRAKLAEINTKARAHHASATGGAARKVWLEIIELSEVGK